MKLSPSYYASVFVGFCIIIAAFGSAIVRYGFANFVPEIPINISSSTSDK
ncbi:MAG: hypothetical protein QME32_04230 [Endomicrobiia bacterium]|nr:hypothetical protein [Endomicrobiia bacterium]